MTTEIRLLLINKQVKFNPTSALRILENLDFLLPQNDFSHKLKTNNKKMAHKHIIQIAPQSCTKRIAG